MSFDFKVHYLNFIKRMPYPETSYRCTDTDRKLKYSFEKERNQRKRVRRTFFVVPFVSFARELIARGCVQSPAAWCPAARGGNELADAWRRLTAATVNTA